MEISRGILTDPSATLPIQKDQNASRIPSAQTLQKPNPNSRRLSFLTGPPHATETHAYREQKQTEVCL